MCKLSSLNKFLFIAFIFLITMGSAMASLFGNKIEVKTENYVFQNEGSNKTLNKSIFIVDKIVNDDSFFSRMMRFPFLVSGYAEPLFIYGRVINSHDGKLNNYTIKLRISSPEWKDINAKENSYVGIGIVKAKYGYGFMCLVNLSSSSTEEREKWLNDPSC